MSITQIKAAKHTKRCLNLFLYEVFFDVMFDAKYLFQQLQDGSHFSRMQEYQKVLQKGKCIACSFILVYKVYFDSKPITLLPNYLTTLNDVKPLRAEIMASQAIVYPA